MCAIGLKKDGEDPLADFQWNDAGKIMIQKNDESPKIKKLDVTVVREIFFFIMSLVRRNKPNDGLRRIRIISNSIQNDSD